MARPLLTSEQVDDFRQRTCEVSMQLFADKGYDGFSLRALARELGCSHATPYRYFADKGEIFAMVRAESYRRFAAFLRKRLDGKGDALARVRVLARGYYDFAQQHRSAFRIMFQLGQPEHDYPFVDEAGYAAWSVLRDVVDEAVAAGALVGKPAAISHTFWAGIHGVATLELARKLTMGQSAAQVFDAMTEALIRAHEPTGKES